MQTVKTSKVLRTEELTGAALDWAVAKCEGEDYLAKPEYDGIGNRYEPTNYSTDWSQGGPIIEREGMHLTCRLNTSYAMMNVGYLVVQHGETPLIAAMRCYVASKLGDTVEVPEELTQ